MTQTKLITPKHLPKTATALEGMQSTVIAMVRWPWPHATEGNATAPSPASPGHCWPAAAVISVSLKPRPDRQSPSADFQNTVQAALDKFVAVLNICANPDTPQEIRTKAEAQRWGYLSFRNGEQSAAQRLMETATNLGLEIPEIAIKAVAAFSPPLPNSQITDNPDNHSRASRISTLSARIVAKELQTLAKGGWVR